VTLEGHATVLLVEDVRRSTDYYRDKLGFEVDLYDRMPKHYGYGRRDACSVHFAHWDGVGPRPNNAVVPPDMFDLYVYVDDVDALYAELAERGAEIHGAPELQGYGMYDFRVSDPDGYVLAFGGEAAGG
jgi:catechol 2,3-dioxygenase-like lactoylglutathione lyase family enzyme